jgi:hypothetical protein
VPFPNQTTSNAFKTSLVNFLDGYRPKMAVSLAHLKLTVRDVFYSQVADESAAYICHFYSTGDNRPILFKNCRLAGLVVDVPADEAFTLDDGTGAIIVNIPTHVSLSHPSIGDYVEVLGQIIGNTTRSITLLCYNLRNDPMEEVRHLLEQAAIHRDMLRFRKALREPFLSSQSSAATGFDRLSDAVLELLAAADPAEGVSLDQILAICDGDRDIAQRLISSLQNDGIVWQNGDSYFAL